MQLVGRRKHLRVATVVVAHVDDEVVGAPFIQKAFEPRREVLQILAGFVDGVMKLKIDAAWAIVSLRAG